MSHAEELVGQPITLSIGEPWDFSSPDGPNVLKGVLVGVQSRLIGKTSIALNVTPFDIGGSSESQLSATARYIGVDIVGTLAKGRSVTVNLVGVNSPVGLIGGLELN